MQAGRKAPLGLSAADLELFSRQGQLGLDREMKRKLPGRCSGIGAYGQTLSLLSRDPCPAALPRTPRASPAPGTDPARGGPSPAPPPRRRQLQRWLQLHAYCLPGLEVFGASLRAELQVGEPEASVPRVSDCRKPGELLLLPTVSGGCSCHSALPRCGDSGTRCSPPAAAVAEPLHSFTENCALPGSRITAQFQSQGRVAQPAEPLRAEAARLASKIQSVEAVA